VGAVSATGHGESILRVGLARTVIERLARGAAPTQAANDGLQEMTERTGGTGGVIVISRSGATAHAATTPQMPWAEITDGGAASGVER
jgi:beta-aspartyl-peptidase (threonine type)